MSDLARLRTDLICLMNYIKTLIERKRKVRSENFSAFFFYECREIF